MSCASYWKIHEYHRLSVKAALTRYKASENRKRNVINAYAQFLKLNGKT